MDNEKNKELLASVASMQEGNTEAFSVIYQYTSDYVYKRAKFIMKNEDDALDLTQETFMQAYKNINSLKEAENIYAWLGSICYRQGMMIFRNRKDILVDEEAEVVFDNIVSEDIDTNPEESNEAKETSDIVMSLIEELPPLQKAAVIAFYYDNKKIDDIALDFDCSANTIKSRLNYAKKFLKEKVEAHEKSHGYRLHSVTPVVVVYALKKLFAQSGYSMAASVSAKVGAAVVGTASTGAIASAAVTSSATGATAASVTTTAGATTVATATTTAATTAAGTAGSAAAMGIGAKIGIGIAAVAMSAGVAFGVVNSSDKVSEPTTIQETTTEMSTPAPAVSFPSMNNMIGDIKNIEGTYRVYGRSTEPHEITISNVIKGDNGITADIDYNGLGARNAVCVSGYKFEEGLIYTDGEGNTYSLIVQCMRAMDDKNFMLLDVSGTITDKDGNVTDWADGRRFIVFSKGGILLEK